MIRQFKYAYDPIVMDHIDFNMEGKKVLVINLVFLAIQLAAKNEVTFVTDIVEAKELFEHTVIANGEFGCDDKCIFIEGINKDALSKEGQANWMNWCKENDMKFDVAIMNPPYNGSLHLKILKEVISICEKSGNEYEIVNISPIRWLQDPLAEYKKNNDWKKYEDVRNKIKTLEVIPTETANSLFNIYGSNLGIYHLTKEGGWQRERNTIIEKIINKTTDVLNNHIEYDNNDGWRVRVSEMRPYPPGRPDTDIRMKCTKFETTHCVLSWVYKDGFTPNGKLYWTENNLNSGHGVKEFTKDTKLPMSIPFNTQEEAVNFENSTKTKFHRYMISKMKVDAHYPFKFVPYLGDYTHPWTDEDLYKYFNLTPEEIKEVEETVK